MKKQTNEIDELISSTNEPEGITVQSADGRLFFLSNEEAKRLAIPKTKLYDAFIAFSQTSFDNAPKAFKKSDAPTRTPKLGPCEKARRWLATHSANSARWRRLCLRYFEVC
jgi:hypothetical protein